MFPSSPTTPNSFPNSIATLAPLIQKEKLKQNLRISACVITKGSLSIRLNLIDWLLGSNGETLSGFFQSFPYWFPLLYFYPFLSPLLLTNQAPVISIKGGTGIVFVLSLISEDICCTRQVFVFILGCYKLRISAVPAGHYLLLAPVFE